MLARSLALGCLLLQGSGLLGIVFSKCQDKLLVRLQLRIPILLAAQAVNHFSMLKNSSLHLAPKRDMLVFERDALECHTSALCNLCQRAGLSKQSPTMDGPLHCLKAPVGVARRGSSAPLGFCENKLQWPAAGKCIGAAPQVAPICPNPPT
jgi:hypothetical protein